MRKLPEKVTLAFNNLATNTGIRYDQASQFLNVLEEEWNKAEEPLVCAQTSFPPPNEPPLPPAPNTVSAAERAAVKKTGRPSAAREAFLSAGEDLLKACSNAEVLPRKYLCKMAGFSTPSFYRYFDSMKSFWSEVRLRLKQDN
jgi:hypothetical protein